VKPIGRELGFWALIICAFCMVFNDQHTGAAVYMVGAVLFDAVKTIGTKNS
jgi:hypothetical protein